jgi:hypothetical protein
MTDTTTATYAGKQVLTLDTDENGVTEVFDNDRSSRGYGETFFVLAVDLDDAEGA